MKLNHSVTGDDAGLPVLLVHGLYGQGRNLGALARRLAETRRVVTVDLRNHGDSPHSDIHDYASLASDLAEVIEAIGGRVDLAGHSMGGKASMVLALTRPELIRKLLVLDIAPIAYGHDQNRYIDAMESLDLQGLDRRTEANRRLSSSVNDPALRAFLLQSLDLKSQPPRWRLNLTTLRREMPKIVGWPDGLSRATFAGPTLFIAGSLSEYITKEGEAAIHAYFPQARTVRLKDAGHWLHADAPEALAKTMTIFLGDGV